MNQKWISIIAAAAFAFSLGTTAEASSGAGILGRILSSGISHSRKAEVRKATVPVSTTSKKNRYKNAMGALQNLQWVGVAKSSGGNIYFDQDTMKDTVRTGERHVTATMKNEFTTAGAKAVAESSHGLVDEDDVSYSLFLVDYGEKECFIASPVVYYDKKGKILAERKATEAFADVTGMNYGKPYGINSMELKIKKQVFTYADRVKEEEKEKQAENQ